MDERTGTGASNLILSGYWRHSSLAHALIIGTVMSVHTEKLELTIGEA